jgi:hypothetical protein
MKGPTVLVENSVENYPRQEHKSELKNLSKSTEKMGVAFKRK